MTSRWCRRSVAASLPLTVALLACAPAPPRAATSAHEPRLRAHDAPAKRETDDDEPTPAGEPNYGARVRIDGESCLPRCRYPSQVSVTPTRVAVELDDEVLDPSEAPETIAQHAAELLSTALPGCPGAAKHEAGSSMVTLQLTPACQSAKQNGMSGTARIVFMRKNAAMWMGMAFEHFAAAGVVADGQIGLETRDGRTFTAAEKSTLQIAFEDGKSRRVVEGRGADESRMAVLAKRYNTLETHPMLRAMSASPLAPLVWLWFYH